MTLLLLYPLFKHSSILVLTVSIMREKEKTFLFWWTFYLLNVLSGKTTERRATSAKKKKKHCKSFEAKWKRVQFNTFGHDADFSSHLPSVKKPTVFDTRHGLSPYPFLLYDHKFKINYLKIDTKLSRPSRNELLIQLPDALYYSPPVDAISCFLFLEKKSKLCQATH